MKNRWRQRGYNLVEIAIVMVVSMMMASWLAVNYFQAQKVERQQETMRTIEIIKEAIVDYAAKHSARSYLVKNNDTAINYLWRTPAGRPYLPCPDITGDGYEDRRPIINTVVVTVAAISSDLEAGGDCYSNKGVVPWRTLDMPPTDYWGNRFTYRVGNNFSNAMLGFDERTRSDQGRYTRPLTVVASMPFRRVAPVGATRSRTTGSTVIISEDAPSIVCHAAPCATNVTADIIAGEVSTVTVTLRTGGYKLSSDTFTEFDADHITNGLPVVIVSHGENGFGAVRGDSTEGTVACIEMPSVGREDERQNAYRNPSQVTAKCPVLTPLDVNAKQYGFVSHIRVERATGDTAEDFDDVVGWMSTDELVSALRKRGVLPVELLPPIGLEE